MKSTAALHFDPDPRSTGSRTKRMLVKRKGRWSPAQVCESMRDREASPSSISILVSKSGQSDLSDRSPPVGENVVDRRKEESASSMGPIRLDAHDARDAHELSSASGILLPDPPSVGENVVEGRNEECD